MTLCDISLFQSHPCHDIRSLWGFLLMCNMAKDIQAVTLRKENFKRRRCGRSTNYCKFYNCLLVILSAWSSSFDCL